MADVEVLTAGLADTIAQLERAGRNVVTALDGAAEKVQETVRQDAVLHRPVDKHEVIGPIDGFRSHSADGFEVTVQTETKPSGKRTPMHRGRPFRVAAALNYAGDKYHYRKTAFRGQSTRGWFSQALPRKRRSIATILARAQAEIERGLGYT